MSDGGGSDRLGEIFCAKVVNFYQLAKAKLAKPRAWVFVLAAALNLSTRSALAQAPGILNYQGKLTVNATNFTGTAQFKFALVNVAGNGTLWSDNGTSVGGAVPNDPPIALVVSGGIFSVNLGDTTVPNMTLAISPNVFTNSGVFLRTWVNDGVDGWQQLIPDRQIVSVGYALSAVSVTGPVAASSLTGSIPTSTLPTNLQALNTNNAVNLTNIQSGQLVGSVSAGVLTSVPAASLTGSVPVGTLPVSLQLLNTNNGINLTNIPAGQLIGSIPVATLNSVPAANLTGSVPSASLTSVPAGNLTGSVPSGALTSVPAASLTGSVPVGTLPANLQVLNINNGGNLTNLQAGQLTGSVPSVTLTSVPASNLTGTLPVPVVQSSLPTGITVVSMLAQDSSLLTNGYQFLMTVPPPAWVNGSTTNAPSARSGHSAIWDGQQMIVWGGNAGSSSPVYVNTGDLYDPVADQWTSVSPIDVPEPRSGHTSIWSGSLMVIWGGENSTNAFLGTGGRFQPTAQQWTPISTSNAPVGRNGHIAVWTGSTMFIWGGQNVNGLLNDGALYDPVADQWTVLSLPNPPEARINATAVWAGDRVIIWGGIGAAGALNDGGELVFSSNAPVGWISTSLTGAPPGRSEHSAVWTGQQMIIWGGNAGGALGDGALFNPASNTWTVVSSTNAPVARYNHSALWSGLEMLILNGSTGAGELASGSAYNPTTGLWRTLSNGGGPITRTQPGAVWTGTQVLVFGGLASGLPVASLQTLVPQPAWYFYSKL